MPSKTVLPTIDAGSECRAYWRARGNDGKMYQFDIVGTFSRLQNAYGYIRCGVRTGVDNWHVVLTNVKIVNLPAPLAGHRDMNAWIPGKKTKELFYAPIVYMLKCITITDRELWLPVSKWKFNTVTDVVTDRSLRYAKMNMFGRLAFEISIPDARPLPDDPDDDYEA